jgi:hypothetical protein
MQLYKDGGWKDFHDVKTTDIAFEITYSNIYYNIYYNVNYILKTADPLSVE